MAKLLTCVLGKPEDPKRNTDDDDVDEQDQKIEKLLKNWNPPEVRVSDIYQLRGGNSELELLYRMFEKKKPLVKIETIKKAVLIKEEYEEFPLLGKDIMGKYMRWYHSLGVRRYSYVHVGLIQVAVKPLTRNGLNSSVVICICDNRFLRVCYKLSSTCLVETKAKVSFSRGNTTIIETNLLKDDVSVPRTISWDSIEDPTKC